MFKVMRANNIVLVISAVLVFSFIYYHKFINTGKPEISVHYNTALPAKKGDLISYTIKFSSKESLEQINISPSIPGANEDSVVEYYFDENTNFAYVNYFYAIPDNIIGVNEITLVLTVKNSNTTIKTSEIIPIFNPPVFASEFIESINGVI